jgi:hypothetical protein
VQQVRIMVTRCDGPGGLGSWSHSRQKKRCDKGVQREAREGVGGVICRTSSDAISDKLDCCRSRTTVRTGGIGENARRTVESGNKNEWGEGARESKYRHRDHWRNMRVRGGTIVVVKESSPTLQWWVPETTA